MRWGAWLFGVVWSLAEERMLISGATRSVLLVGFMGAFTTFSTFAFETGQMLDDSQWLTAAANLLAQNVLGVALVLVGMAVGRLFLAQAEEHDDETFGRGTAAAGLCRRERQVPRSAAVRSGRRSSPRSRPGRRDRLAGHAQLRRHSQMHSAKVLHLSESLPMVIEIVDEPEKIAAFLPELDAMIGEGMVTLEKVNVIIYRQGGN